MAPLNRNTARVPRNRTSISKVLSVSEMVWPVEVEVISVASSALVWMFTAPDPTTPAEWALRSTPMMGLTLATMLRRSMFMSTGGAR